MEPPLGYWSFLRATKSLTCGWLISDPWIRLPGIPRPLGVLLFVAFMVVGVILFMLFWIIVLRKRAVLTYGRGKSPPSDGVIH